MSKQSTSAPAHQQPKRHAHNWSGGRVVASNGYILIYVGKDHPLADVRGYAYEHRLVAERAIGRPLLDGELVHHKDENKQNNDPSNLEVVQGNAEHFVRHRRSGVALRLPGEPNPVIQCSCGCGTSFLRYNGSGRPRAYVSGHNPPRANFAAELLWYLEYVPEPTTTRFVASFFAVEERKVTVAMSRLKRQGKVELLEGCWGLAHV
jgi:hypothetical protein